MTDIEWGPAIAVDGKRPGFVRDDDIFQAGGGGFDWYGNLSNGTPHIWNQSPNREPNWNAVDRIRLPSDHPHYRQPATIDWSKPIEALHEDGRVVAVRRLFSPPGTYHVGPHLEGGWFAFDSDGKHITRHCPWRIRNVPQPTPQADTKPDLTARKNAMTVAEVREMLAHDEATIIATLIDWGFALPEPADPDEEAVQSILASWNANELETTEDAIREAVRYGRALALAGEKEA
ncbi:hypothetical protein [Sphingomonas abaci]|uniref:Uncharacterized protein n=1 Tax=Sphingomonas abaci TaxID=237611 RepID=A0A7W7AMQ0_9SPHN|nr:hypothetical protein [Sphingomonas abaci]MBB4618975.1 hypothetical protein [Sphingomonas abaci]